jgi:hypothetical protein
LSASRHHSQRIAANIMKWEKTVNPYTDQNCSYAENVSKISHNMSWTSALFVQYVGIWIFSSEIISTQTQADVYTFERKPQLCDVVNTNPFTAEKNLNVDIRAPRYSNEHSFSYEGKQASPACLSDKSSISMPIQ